MNLKSLGWSKRFAEAFSAVSQPAWIPGRVVSEHRGTLVLVTEQGELPAVVPGRLQHLAATAAELPKIGDWVAVAPRPGENKGVIQCVLPRHSQLGRKVPGRVTTQQILAANVDVVFIVQALDASFRPRKLERFLMVAHEGNVRPVILLNKADVCTDPAPIVDAAKRVAGEVTILVTSAETRRGLKALSALIRPTETVVFLGSSGVGKSSLINRLCGEEFQTTLEVRERDSKGRHATTARELLPLPGGGLVIDTPGLRELQLWANEEALDEAFAEISVLAQGCRFRDCRHVDEPDCRVRSAVDSGALPRARYDSFLKLSKEQESLVASSQERVYRVRQRQTRVIQKAMNVLNRRHLEDE